MIPLNYHHLYYFHVIAREGSIAKACQVLYLAQPTLSAQLRQLEKALGVRLFNRVKQRLQLTEDGRFVLNYAESIFEMGRELQDALGDKDVQGRYHVQLGVVNGTPRSFAHALMHQALQFPRTGLVRLTDDRLGVLMEQLKSHQIDGLLSDVPATSAEADFDNHVIAKIPIVFAGCGALLKRVKRIPDDLEGAPVILPSAPSQVQEQVMTRMAEWGVKPLIVAQVQDLEIVRRLVLDGHGIAPMNTHTLQMSTPANRLKAIPSSKPIGIVEPVYLITRKRRWMNPVIEHLISHFRLPR